MSVFIAETSVAPLLTKNFDTKSRGRWQTWVHCTQLPKNVPDIQVVVFGRKGKSPAQKVQNLNDSPFLVSFFFISHKSHETVSIKVVVNVREVVWNDILFIKVNVYTSVS